MINEQKKGCRDVWNAFMCDGASYSSNDIPICPTTAEMLPAEIIPWDEAKHIYKNALARGDTEFFYNAFVCWYIDDYKFDGPRGIWHDCAFALKVLRHFAGVIWDGISDNSIVCIGTVGGSPRKLIDRKRFEEGLEELVRVRNPHTILVYGSASYPCFDKLIDHGIKVISYPSRTASAFERRRAR